MLQSQTKYTYIRVRVDSNAPVRSPGFNQVAALPVCKYIDLHAIGHNAVKECCVRRVNLVAPNFLLGLSSSASNQLHTRVIDVVSLGASFLVEVHSPGSLGKVLSHLLGQAWGENRSYQLAVMG